MAVFATAELMDSLAGAFPACLDKALILLPGACASSPVRYALYTARAPIKDATVDQSGAYIFSKADATCTGRSEQT